MRFDLRNLLLVCQILLFTAFVGFSRLASPVPIRPQITIERVERVSGDEVRFAGTVANKADVPIYLLGFNDELGPRLYPIYIEQAQTTGWKTVAPCMDTPPPHVIKLNPSASMTRQLGVKLPPPAICKERNIRLEGKFRLRVEYFETPKQARAYVNKIFSSRWKQAHAPFAVSEPFEIPPAPSGNNPSLGPTI